MKALHSTLTALVAIVLFASGCMKMNMTSQVNRAAVPEQIQRVLVVGGFSDLALKESAETRLCDELSSKTRSLCFRSFDYASPGVGPNAAIQEAAPKVNADAFLLLRQVGEDSRREDLQKIECTRDTCSSAGPSGIRVTKLTGRYEISLYVPDGDSPVWHATSSVDGNAFHDWQDLVSATAAKAVEKLMEDGVLKPLSG